MNVTYPGGVLIVEFYFYFPAEFYKTLIWNKCIII